MLTLCVAPSPRTQIQRIAALDSSWAHLGNGLNAHNNPAWLQLYLAVCKLLDMCLVMAADQVPQFQLYRWAFVGTAGEEDYDTFYEEEDHTSQHRPNPLFTPHIIRLSRLINLKLKKRPALLPCEPGRPLLTMHRMRSLAELQPFFHTLVVSHAGDCHMAASSSPAALRQNHIVRQASRNTGLNGNVSGGGGGRVSEADKKGGNVEDPAAMTNRQYIEHLLQADFLEVLS
ncbi:protein dopey-1 [Plakobranchus ocellatus]|uniref:Protein dopey-1 n=1 Tax=Plakobranchus ocellatus TaxID=259542 RepID=A0AAV4DSF3_9GAST|nr:protein dopey-1 [Plakobranchus ocellatus]